MKAVGAPDWSSQFATRIRAAKNMVAMSEPGSDLMKAMVGRATGGSTALKLVNGLVKVDPLIRGRLEELTTTIALADKAAETGIARQP
eukprot:6348727-Amphidinium_carterae.1